MSSEAAHRGNGSSQPDAEADLSEAHRVAGAYNPRSHSVDASNAPKPRIERPSPRVRGGDGEGDLPKCAPVSFAGLKSGSVVYRRGNSGSPQDKPSPRRPSAKRTRTWRQIATTHGRTALIPRTTRLDKKAYWMSCHDPRSSAQDTGALFATIEFECIFL